MKVKRKERIGAKINLTWLKLVGVLMAIVIVVVVSYLGYYWGSKKWSYGERFTVLEVDKAGVRLISIDPAQGLGVKLQLPGQLEMEMRGGMGKYRVEVFGELLQRESSEWLADSVSDFLGVAIVGVEADLNPVDKLRWWWYLKGMRMREVELSQSQFVSASQAVDGVPIVDLSAFWRDALGDWFVAKKIADEQLNLTVINTTGTPGLAARATRMIEAMGIKVGMIRNDNVAMDRCKLESATDLKNSLGMKWLVKQFGCEWEENDLGEQGVQLKLGKQYQSEVIGN